MFIGSLAAKLTAQDAGFSSTLNRAQKQVSSFVKSVGAISLGVSIGNAISGAVSAVPSQLASVVTNQMEAIDKAAKTSDTLGVATEKLLGLGYAGDLAGASMETVTGALVKMQKAIGEAIGGSDTARQAISAIGLDLSALSGLDAVDQFKAIGDALNKIENPAQRTAAAMDIFGKSAAEVIPLLASGSEGMNAAAKEAEAFGLAINRVDAAKIEQANDSITRVKSLISGVGSTIAVELAPFVTKVATDFVAWATDGGRATKFIIDAMEWVSLAVVKVYEGVQSLRAAWYYVEGAVIFVAKTILEQWSVVIGAIVKGLDTVGLATDGMKESAAAFSEVVTGLGVEAKESFKKASDIMDDIGSDAAANRLKNYFAVARAGADSYGKAVAQASQGAKQSIDVEGAERIKAVQGIIGKLSDELASLTTSPLEKVVKEIKAAGAAQADIAKATDLMNQIDLTKFSQSVLTSIRTPADEFQTTIDKLRASVEAGLLTGEQAAKFAESKIPDAAKALDTPNPALIQANTAQALLFSLNQQKKPVEDQQLAEQKSMAASLKNIEKNTQPALAETYADL